MKSTKVGVELQNNSHKYQINIGHDLLTTSGSWGRNCLSDNAHKIVLVSNAKVYRLYGKPVAESFESLNFEVYPFLIGDGERYKSFQTLTKLLKFIGANKITRTDAVVALGGGVVGDLAGFAAAVFMRGLSFLQIPTTLLAMIDSSVGGKTGVNTAFGKNLIGAFHQPHGVLIDVETLQTLPRRELVAGFCEAIKQAAIADANLFKQTAEFLESFPLGKSKKHFLDDKYNSALENLIAAQVAFKAQIVMQDEKESIIRTDGKSRKILNFGHTLAHALEKVTDYKRFKHGEAVGLGIKFAAELSKKLEILDSNELNLLNDVFLRVGDLPDTKDISLEKVFEAFAFDKKTVGKSLQWILLRKIGEPVIIENKDISVSIIHETLRKVLHE